MYYKVWSTKQMFEHRKGTYKSKVVKLYAFNEQNKSCLLFQTNKNVGHIYPSFIKHCLIICLMIEGYQVFPCFINNSSNVINCSQLLIYCFGNIFLLYDMFNNTFAMCTLSTNIHLQSCHLPTNQKNVRKTIKKDRHS